MNVPKWMRMSPAFRKIRALDDDTKVVSWWFIIWVAGGFIFYRTKLQADANKRYMMKLRQAENKDKMRILKETELEFNS